MCHIRLVQPFRTYQRGLLVALDTFDKSVGITASPRLSRSRAHEGKETLGLVLNIYHELPRLKENVGLGGDSTANSVKVG